MFLPPETLASFNFRSIYLANIQEVEAPSQELPSSHTAPMVVHASKLEYFSGCDPKADNDFKITGMGRAVHLTVAPKSLTETCGGISTNMWT